MTSAIPRCPEWDRINALPVRSHPPAEIAYWQGIFSSAWRTPTGNQTLLPDQAASLLDFAATGGLICCLPVGAGKTHISALAPNLFPGHKQALLLQPAGLIPKTKAAIADLRTHWQITDRMTIASYERMQTIKGAAFLEELAPDMIICDEAHALRNMQAARTRRFIRYCASRPHVKLLMLSGSMAKRSVLDYWHLCLLALGAGSPLPRNRTKAEHWAQALDSGIEDYARPPAGALRRWCGPEGNYLPEVEVSRRGYRKRFRSVAGCIVTHATPIATDLVVSETQIDVPEEVKTALDAMESTWETPGGDVLQYAPEIWRHQRELACGFFYRWDPPPPEHWLQARREWRSFVRTVLSRDDPDLDSPMQVTLRYQAHPLLAAWRSVEDDYEVHRKTVWVSDGILHQAANWLEDQRGICWVEHQAVGKRLSEITGLPYYGAGKHAARDILTATGPIIVSIQAHRQGQNLQRYHKNLVLTAPTSGDAWDQLLGRTHRPGQDADTVYCDVYLHHAVLARALRQAIEDATFWESTTGQPNRLLRAQKHLPSVDTGPDY